ncbi:MAG: TetR/AcrR family transcriptional regulator [Spirochaetia bacterium]|nr:TetR/AcrR family transcriptional regulator [Spirochaetia bacterium]
MRTTGPRTKQALLAAGIKLFEKHGIAGASVDDIVREAGVAKGSFYTHFADRSEFLLFVHRTFHDDLRDQILEIIGPMQHGLDRLGSGTTVYLDGCLNSVGVKSLLFEARVEPALRDEVARRNAMFSKVVEADLRAAGWPLPAEAAKLFVGMAAEAAYLEMKAGKKLPRVRKALRNFLASD